MIATGNKLDVALMAWANPETASYDSWLTPALPEKQTIEDGVCQTCMGQQVIAYSSACVRRAQPCPHCLPSSISSQQRVGHTQIVHFTTGEKKTIEGVQRHWENEMVHVIDGTGKEFIINKSNVLFVEIVNP